MLFSRIMQLVLLCGYLLIFKALRLTVVVFYEKTFWTVVTYTFNDTSSNSIIIEFTIEFFSVLIHFSLLQPISVHYRTCNFNPSTIPIGNTTIVTNRRLWKMSITTVSLVERYRLLFPALLKSLIFCVSFVVFQERKVFSLFCNNFLGHEKKFK